MDVLFLSPHYPREMQDFVRGLAEVGAAVYALGDVPQEQVPEHVRRYLRGYWTVPSLFDEAGLVSQVRSILGDRRPDRIEALWEPCVLPAARLREALDVPGMRYETALGFRDKAVMKQRLQAAGVRVPKFARVSTAQQVWEAVEDIGFPVVVKPVSGAGSADTYRVGSAEALAEILPRLGHVPEASVEECIDGDELTYDTVCIDGQPVFESVAQYFPKPIEARSLEWISPAQIVYADPHRPELEGGIAMGRRVLEVLGMDSGFTHMEWFRKPDGEVVFGEIASRAPGGRLVDQMNFANDFDVFREWARAVCHHTFEAEPARHYHVATIFKRAIGQGRIQRIDGLDAVRQHCGQWLVVEDLLGIGEHRRDWRNTLVSDGYLTVRHPDYDACVELMNRVIADLRLYAG